MFMKKHLFLRGLAWLVCLSLVMGLVPGGIIGNLLKVNAVSEEMVEADLNGSFETLDAEGKPANWKTSIGADGTFAINTEDVAEGKNAVQITALTKGNYLKSALVPTKEGDTYELTFKAKVLSGSGSIYGGLWFASDNAGTLVDGNAEAPTVAPTDAPSEPPFSRPTYQYQDTEPATLPPLAPTREGD